MLSMLATSMVRPLGRAPCLQLRRNLHSAQHMHLSSTALSMKSRHTPLHVTHNRMKSTATSVLPSESESENVTSQINTEIKNTSPVDVFAVVHVGGAQYRVAVNDVIVTQTLQAEVGKKIYLEKVLCAGGRGFSLIGAPLLDKSTVRVSAIVTEHSKTEKVIVFKMKRKKNYKRWKGHRQNITTLRIIDVNVIGV